MRKKSEKEQLEKSIYRPIRCSVELDETIGRLACQQKLSKSEVLRDLVYKGLEASNVTVEKDPLYELVKKAVAETLKPNTERLAAISAKATQISSAAFFMGIYAATRNCDADEQQSIQEAAESARALGIQYLKLKDRDIDSFIKEGARQITNE